MILSVYLRALLYKKSFWLGASSTLWSVEHNANIILEQNWRAQQKYNKFTVHGELQVLIKALCEIYECCLAFQGNKLCDVNAHGLYTPWWYPKVHDSSLHHWE